MHRFFAHLLANVMLITPSAVGIAFGEERIPDKVAYDCSAFSTEVKKAPPTNYQSLDNEERELVFTKNRRCVLWLQSNFIVPSASDYVLQIQYPTLDWVEPWIDGKALAPQGSSLPISTRIVKTHLPTWVIPLAPGSHILELEVVDTTGQRRVPFSFSPAAEYLPLLESRSFTDGALLGLLFFNILTAIVLAIVLGSDISGALYACVVISTTIYLGITSGHAFPLLFPRLPQINSFIQQQAALVSSAMLTFWVLKLQDTERFLPRWNRVACVLASILLGFALLLPLSLISTLADIFQHIREGGFLDVLSIICLFMTLGITISLVRNPKRNHSAILLTGIIAPIASIVLGFAHDLGLIHMSLITRVHLLESASVTMFVMLSGMLTYRLYRKIQESTALEHRFSTTVVQTADRDRERLARELHDDVGQRLVALQYQLYNANVPELGTQVREILKDLRHMAHGLHPAHLINSRLGDALETYSRDLEAKGICQITVSLDAKTLAIEGEYALHLLRIFQEITSNALRHGKATMINIEGVVRGGMHVISVENDGRPLPENLVEGLGFTSIRARMRLLEGTLEIHAHSHHANEPILTLSFPC